MQRSISKIGLQYKKLNFKNSSLYEPKSPESYYLDEVNKNMKPIEQSNLMKLTYSNSTGVVDQIKQKKKNREKVKNEKDDNFNILKKSQFFTVL